MNRLEFKDINQQVRREAWATRPAIDVGRAMHIAHAAGDACMYSLQPFVFSNFFKSEMKKKTIEDHFLEGSSSLDAC